MSRMTRSATGLDTPRDEWRELAMCRASPDMWFEPKSRPLALHICLTHCPVVEQCLRDGQAHPPKEGVQGGIAYNFERQPLTAAYHKPAPSCPLCRAAPVRDPATDTGACGTYLGYRRHLQRREQACAVCRAAVAEKRRQYKQRLRAQRGSAPEGEE